MAYDVFISSTFADFSKERKRIAELLRLIQINAILAEEMGDKGKDLRTTLTNLIDQSDMIVLLIGSRAGSWTKMGNTWTQAETNYAFAKNKRVFAYIREIPDEIQKLVDIDDKKQESINNFINFVDEKIALVPRFKKKECCKLIAMVIRDIERYANELRDNEAYESYMEGFD